MENIVDFFEENYDLFYPHFIIFSDIKKYDTSYYEYCNQLYSNGIISEDNKTLKRTIESLRNKFLNQLINKEEPNHTLKLLFSGLTLASNRIKGLYPIRNNVCFPGTKISVNPDGTFHICERINDTYPIGNVNLKISLEKIKNIEEEYIRLTQNKCQKCPVSRLCNLCYAHLIKDGRLVFNEQYCNDSKKAIDDLLKIIYHTLELNPKAFDNLVDSSYSEFMEVNR